MSLPRWMTARTMCRVALYMFSIYFSMKSVEGPWSFGTLQVGMTLTYPLGCYVTVAQGNVTIQGVDN